MVFLARSVSPFATAMAYISLEDYFLFNLNNAEVTKKQKEVK